MRKHAFLVGALVAVLGAQRGLAGDSTPREDRAATSDEKTHVIQALETRGYKNVHGVEVDDGRFEADATSPAGHDVDLELDMRSLDVVHEYRD